MRRRSTAVPLLLALVSLAGARQAKATTILFSNLGPGSTYNSSSGYTVSGSASAPGLFTEASSFTPAQTATLDSIDAALAIAEGANEVNLLLAADAAGLPGPTLESFHLAGLPQFGSTGSLLTSATSLLHPLLTAGVQYWVVFAAPVANTWAVNNLNITGDTGAAFSSGGPFTAGPNEAAGAFQVRGTVGAVPEPASILLLGSGLIGVGARRYQRRRP